ncbi:MAG TPA: ABC transporter ATP-binding protein [Blastocatellia bacterium]|nr:ABC transporter ATP-binding protein [Blastocatellia bacterium]
MREEEKLGQPDGANFTWRLLRYLRPYRWQVILALILTLAMTPLELAGPFLFHIGIDWYLVPYSAGQLSARAATWGLAIAVLMFLGFSLGCFLLQYVQVRVMQRIGQQVTYDLRREIFEHLQRLPLRFLDRTPVGQLVTRATTDVDALNELFATGVVTILNSLVLMLGMGLMLFIWHPFLALASLWPLPFIMIMTPVFQRIAGKANWQARTKIAQINTFLNEHLGGMAVVQLFNRQEKAGRQFAGLNQALLKASCDGLTAFSFYFSVVELACLGGLALLSWVGGLRVIEGSLPIGVLIAFMMYAQRFFQPILELGEKLEVVAAALPAAQRIFQLLDEPVTSALPAEPRPKAATPGEIEFRNVWFAYEGGANPEDEHWVLRDVSFRAKAGQTIAIVGQTGSGKTTLIQLLLRFYDIQRGQILLDGMDLRELDLPELRSLFGIVPQDSFLFAGTLESNVKLGTEGLDRASAEQALRQVGLGPFLESQAQGIETPVTERGSTLSMGQRQLISFARALAHNPRFLILDEATASVDTKTEHLIQSALDRLLKGRTAVVIAHRLSTIKHADRILVMHKGRLSEQGSHQELLLQRGIYYRLYQLQDQEQASPDADAPESLQPMPALN